LSVTQTIKEFLLFSKNKTKTNKAQRGSKITKEPCLHGAEETPELKPNTRQLE